MNCLDTDIEIRMEKWKDSNGKDSREAKKYEGEEKGCIMGRKKKMGKAAKIHVGKVIIFDTWKLKG